jgi:hypothetical protein
MAEGEPSDREELERLQAEVASLRAQLQRSTVTAHGGSQIAMDGGVAAGKVAVGGDVHGDVIVAMDAALLLDRLGEKRPPADLKQATGAYLDYLVDYYRCLDLRGMGISDRVPLRLPLLDMYTSRSRRAGRLLPERPWTASSASPAGGPAPRRWRAWAADWASPCPSSICSRSTTG